MQTRFIIAAALLGLGFAVMALTHPDAQPPAPEQKSDATPGNAAALPVPPVPRGQLLYENHCMACHESVVHIRTRQSARTLAELQERVEHWARYLKLTWSAEDVRDVTGFLDSRYYRFESRP